jgi:thiamine-phosphate pyrophosphorylase
MPRLPHGESKFHDLIDFSLYLISDRHQTAGRPLLDVVRAALQGGIRAIQLREKDLVDTELLKLAHSLRRLTDEYGARLLINRRVDICQAVKADGVHLGADGISIIEARQALGNRQLIGYSAHSLDEACTAETAGADFITFGPVFATPSKAAYGQPLGIDRLKETCGRLTIPVFALGGIKREAITQVMAAGAHGIALISALITALDPTTEAQSMLQAIEEHAIHPNI